MAKKLISEDPKASKILFNISKAEERVARAKKAKEALEQQIKDRLATKDRDTTKEQVCLTCMARSISDGRSGRGKDCHLSVDKWHNICLD